MLDLGEQPACDYFPAADDAGPDPTYPLAMWLCAGCGLAQLTFDPTTPEEPRGAEPAALVAQAADAVTTIAAAGLLSGRRTVAEYGSPHGGSWLPLLAARGLRSLPHLAVGAGSAEAADVVVDCFGLMHAADQAAAIRQRAARVAPGGVLLLQYHALATIVRDGQWNALRHGHYAYYSAAALAALLAQAGFVPRSAWHFDLYGGTILLAAARDCVPDQSVRRLVAADAAFTCPEGLTSLRDDVTAQASALHSWLAAQDGTVLGYGAASRAVALLTLAGVDRDLLPAVADASPAKHGRRMPGTSIPIISPAELVAASPARVLLFLADLLPELRETLPALDGRWALPPASLGKC